MFAMTITLNQTVVTATMRCTHHPNAKLPTWGFSLCMGIAGVNQPVTRV